MRTFQVKVSPLKASRHTFGKSSNHSVVAYPMTVSKPRVPCTKSFIEMSIEDLEMEIKSKKNEKVQIKRN